MVIVDCPHPGRTFNTSDLTDALAATFLHIHASGSHSGGTVVKTMQLLLLRLHMSRKFNIPLYLQAVPLTHGLISTSDGKTMLLPQRSLVKIVLFSSWNAAMRIYGKI